jgi:excisionase family DNA binding protein
MAQMTESSEQLRTVEEEAAVHGVSPKTVRRWIARGELAVVRYGRIVRIHPSDSRAFIARHRAG